MMFNWLYKLEQLPSIKDILSKKYDGDTLTTLSRLYTLLLVIITGAIWFLVPKGLGLVSLGYWSTLGFLLVARLIFPITLLYLSKDIVGNAARRSLQVAVIGLGLLPIFMLLPFNFGNTTTISGDNYVTYAPSCPYCTRAHNSMLASVNLYNQTHSNKIKLINLDEESDAASEIRKHIAFKGTAVNLKDLQGQKLYTAKDANGKPAKPKVNQVWEIINQVHD